MGIMLCRELFYSCFGTTDQQEGMAAFLEKRPAVWKEGKKPM
jgi:enoyl-CoA hydratase